MNNDKQLAEAAVQYFTQLAVGEPVAPDILVAPELQRELRELIATRLEFGQPEFVLPMSAEEQVAAGRVASRMQAKLKRRLAPRTLTTLRTARKLSLAALAQALDLPTDVLARLERGGIIAASLPARLITQLGTLLDSAEAEVRAALTVAPRAAAVRLNARDGTSSTAEQPVSFAEALRASAATPQQRTAWREPPTER